MTFTKEQLREKLEHRITVAAKYPDVEEAQLDADIFKLALSALAGMEAEPVVVSDDMAYAFHHALSDSSLGADEVEEIKTGLRAAFANVVTPQPLTTSERAELENYRNAQQVVLDIDSMRLIFEAVEHESDDGFNLHKYGIGYADEATQKRWQSWLSCRAAMLQGAEHVSNRDELPDGWVAVPVEPTAEMYDAGDRQLATKQVWDAMIAAVPQQVE